METNRSIRSQTRCAELRCLFKLFHEPMEENHAV